MVRTKIGKEIKKEKERKRKRKKHKKENLCWTVGANVLIQKN